MRRRLFHGVLILVSTIMLLGLLSVAANAASYPYGKMTFSTMPTNWQNITVKVGNVTMPLSRFPDGHVSNDAETEYLSVQEMQEYGISRSSSLWVRGSTCVGFARHVYAALFYKYPQNATMDTALGTSFANSYYYYDVIKEVYGTKELAPGYSAATLKELFSYCRPGAVFSAGHHTMVLMAIYDNGFLIYDCNFSGPYEIDVRMYTWDRFVSSMGSRGIQGLHMPVYYPGFTYSTGSGYPLNTAEAGEYVVYFCTELNVRAQPSDSWQSDKLGKLPAGTTVNVLGTYNGWGQINYNGTLAWLSMDYLKPKAKEVSVTFDGNGATPSFTSRVYTAGEYFGTMPSASKTNRTLIGWSSGTNVYTEASIVPAAGSLALKAKWGVLTFLDVDESAWYAKYVEDGTNLGLFMRADYFNPTSNSTRAQFITVLGREYERETGTTITGTGNGGFSDVVPGSYYSKYVVWGARNGIVLGMGNGTFGTKDNLTREQLATFLFRMASKSGLVSGSSSFDTSVLQRFGDGSKVSDYAKQAMSWAVSVKILMGDDKGKLNPKSPATRAEMATMFSRYVNYYNTTPKSAASILR